MGKKDQKKAGKKIEKKIDTKQLLGLLEGTEQLKDNAEVTFKSLKDHFKVTSVPLRLAINKLYFDNRELAEKKPMYAIEGMYGTSSDDNVSYQVIYKKDDKGNKTETGGFIRISKSRIQKELRKDGQKFTVTREGDNKIILTAEPK